MARGLDSLRTWIQRGIRWGVPILTLTFLATSLWHHGQEALAVPLPAQAWIHLGAALLITGLAHLWAGWSWGLILQFLQQVPPAGWSMRIYLTTNLAKYLPGNIWHFYGRIQAATEVGIPLGIAALSVGLEPILMVAAALVVVFLAPQTDVWQLQILGLAGLLISIHPRVLNQIIPRLTRKALSASAAAPSSRVEGYPLIPLMAEGGFVLLRGLGFCLVLAISAPAWFHLPQVLSRFSLAWVLGLIVPGAPGGLGVFESMVLVLLESTFSPAALLNSVALYRVMSLLAESLAAGLAWSLSSNPSQAKV